MSRDRKWAVALLIVGSLQMVGDVLGVPALIGLGAASHASPAPKVFTTVGDAEPFSATFAIELERASGRVERIPLDRARYERLRGPYNRRNVVGAVVAGGPHLHDTEHVGPMMEAAARWALCDGVVLDELTSDADSGSDSDSDSAPGSAPGSDADADADSAPDPDSDLGSDSAPDPGSGSVTAATVIQTARGGGVTRWRLGC